MPTLIWMTNSIRFLVFNLYLERTFMDLKLYFTLAVEDFRPHDKIQEEENKLFIQ